MCDQDEDDDNNNNNRNDNSTRSRDQQQLQRLLMELDNEDDHDMDLSWPLDQMPLVSSSPNNPMMMMMISSSSPPLIINSSSEQPCSPLWAFSDGADDEKLSSASAAAPPPPPPFRLTDYPLFLTCTPSSVAENATENNSNGQLPSPFMGLMPLENSDSYWLIKERMTQALRYFKESTEQHILAQVWAPVKNGGRYMLTTSGQPFVLDPHSNGLNQYRMVSLSYMFFTDGGSDVELGLPGRVFRQKLPEWTPNVQYYSSKEFARLDHALNYNVRGTLALPVFGPSRQSCVGVVELIMTSEKIHYAPDVDKVCKALEAVNLKSSEILDHQTTQICNQSRQNALAEIQEILTVVCETHKLPLAQTWVLCRHRSVLCYGGGLKKSCTSFDGSCMGQVCVSTTDVAVYVVDAHIWGFREACLEHHLQKGQGVAGRAFLNRNSCFCRDVTQFCKTDYPLVHYARMFKLSSSFAICLQSSHTGDDDYILEFFLPPTITDKNELDALLGCLLATMKQHFQSLRVASGADLGDNEVSVEVIAASIDKKIDSRIEYIQIPCYARSPLRPSASPNEDELQLNLSNQQPLMMNSDPQNNKGNNGGNVGESNANASAYEVKEMKKPERKRGKTEKTISLEVLQQYFAGSLKDAAKSLGVCPTTMKRICRQHGISRWPSRKINKVNRSLTKLKCVIESVQGTDGALDLTSLTSSPLPVAVGSISWPSNPNGSYQLNSPASKPPEPLVPANNSLNGASPASDAPAGGADEQPLGGRTSPQEHTVQEQSGFPELVSNNGCKRSKTGSGSREGSAGTPTSHGSCEGSPANETKVSNQDQCFTVGGGLPEIPFQPPIEHDLSSAFPLQNPHLATELREQFGGMLVEDAGSSKDLRSLCHAVSDEKFPELSWINPGYNNTVPPKEAIAITQTMPRVPSRSEMRSITIKATYREDVIRFRLPLSSGIMELKEEVAKRLKLEVGTFEIKYLDDDQEWVLTACDADLQECLDIAISSGSNIVRLAIHDMMTNLGSSCESTGEL